MTDRAAARPWRCGLRSRAMRYVHDSRMSVVPALSSVARGLPLVSSQTSVKLLKLKREAGDEQRAHRDEQERKGDAAERRPPVGPVDEGGFLEVGRDALQRTSVDEEHVRVAEPEVDEDQREHRHRRRRQPGDVDTEPLVDAKRLVEHPLPHQRRHEARQGVRDDQQRPVDLAALHPHVVEHDGEEQAEGERDDDGGEGEGEVPGRAPG